MSNIFELSLFINSHFRLLYRFHFRYIEFHAAVIHCRCPETTYVAKTDDDIYVNVPLFVRRLVEEAARFRSAFGDAGSRSFIAGHVIDAARPVRDRRSKWYTPETMYAAEFYPPYTSGTAYAMGFDVARRILDEV